MSLFTALGEWLRPAAAPSPEVAQTLARITPCLDPLLRVAPGLPKRLADPLATALAYCRRLADQVPGPFAINHAAFAQDSLIHALFATVGDIDETLGRSPAIRDFLATSQSWGKESFYALFAARRQLKRQLGVARQGDTLINDVPQDVLYFSSQTLHAPSADLAELRAYLGRLGVDSLVQTFNEHVNALRRAHGAPAVTIVSPPGIATSAFPPRQIPELEETLRQGGYPPTPKSLLKTLADFLAAPQPAIQLKPVTLTVDRLGIVCQTPATDAQTLGFSEFCARDRRRHVVMLVRIDTGEARAAVEQVRDDQKRFLLI